MSSGWLRASSSSTFSQCYSILTLLALGRNVSVHSFPSPTLIVSRPLQRTTFYTPASRSSRSSSSMAATCTCDVIFCQTPTEPPGCPHAAAAKAIGGQKTILLLGKRSVVSQLDVAKTTGLAMPSTFVSALFESISKSSGGLASTFVGGANENDPQHHILHCGLLPETVSRHVHQYSVHTISEHVGKVKPTHIYFCATALELDRSLVDAVTAATARARPLYSRKTTKKSSSSESSSAEENGGKVKTTVQMTFVDETGKVYADYVPHHATALYHGVQLACRLVDMPPAELTTTTFSQEVHDMFHVNDAASPVVTVREIVGAELDEKGYGGLYNVGKAATEPPRLVICEYTPPPTSADADAATTDADPFRVALVGKGIVYDTGGLALKSRDGMCGMKHDMGGAAGLLGAFYALCQRRVPAHVTLILCLAENAIGPTAFRNDDILTLYSGQTVEINNSDAEGRLVLADGVAHATKHIPNLNLVVDMATLTGAQLITTGKKHAGILATSADLEQRTVEAGLQSGDLVYPMLYCPELLVKEFDSKVADMKNSVKDRSNAQSSCAGHFVEAHLHESYKGEWLHIDMAGPGSKDDRGTGYGVALVTALVEQRSRPKKVA
jgi:probable aminopeptidase NPEPL1